MHVYMPENTKPRTGQSTSGRAASHDAPTSVRGTDDEGYPFDDLTCDLSAEPIAAATRLRDQKREGLVDPNPTLESPPLRTIGPGAQVPRSFPNVSPTMSPPAPQGRPLSTPKAAAPAVKRAPAAQASPTIIRIPERAAARAENATMFDNTTILDPPAKIKAPPPAQQLPLAEPPAPPAAAEPSESALPPGQLLRDRYELQLLLGRGGMASVYKAIDRDRVRLGLTDRMVAVKVVQADDSRPASPAALIQEFQSAQRLSHPNVINVFDIDQDGDTTFYSMELLSGARLSQLLRRVDGSVLRQRYALAIIRDIGAAVTHAHARGVVHADLKPSNVMITQEGEVRVLDFGGSSMPPREPWVSAGDADDAYHQATPAYASCEQLERRRADPRDDIYALACIAYLLLAGRHPFDYLSSIEARSRGMKPHRPPGMPRGRWRALRQGLMWSRANQPAAIEPWLERLDLAGAVRKLPPLADMTAAATPRARWLRPLAVAAATIAVGVSAGFLLSQADGDWNQQLDATLARAEGALQNVWLLFDDRNEKPAPAANTAAAAAVPPPVAAIASPPPAAAAVVRGGQTIPPRTIAQGSGVISSANANTVPAAVAAAPAAAAPVADTAAAHVAFATMSYVVGSDDPAARVVIQRAGNVQGDLSFIWWTEADSAEPDVDYASLGVRTEHLASGQDRLTVYVPIISNPLRRHSTQFHVMLADASSHRGNGGAPNARATVTIEGSR